MEKAADVPIPHLRAAVAADTPVAVLLPRLRAPILRLHAAAATAEVLFLPAVPAADVPAVAVAMAAAAGRAAAADAADKISVG